MAHILVIEDDEHMRGSLAQTLERLGHRVTTAVDGRAGVESAAAAPPDLVITDLIMPEKEGLETIVELRQQHPLVRIIAMSGGGRLSNEDYLHLAKRFGAHFTLAKPFTRDELKAVLAQALAS
jgi:DNA-binding response OmpR family regulator